MIVKIECDLELSLFIKVSAVLRFLFPYYIKRSNSLTDLTIVLLQSFT